MTCCGNSFERRRSPQLCIGTALSGRSLGDLSATLDTPYSYIIDGNATKYSAANVAVPSGWPLAPGTWVCYGKGPHLMGSDGTSRERASARCFQPRSRLALPQ